MKFITPNAATAVFNGKPLTIHSTHPNFQKVVDLLKSDDYTEEQIRDLIDVRHFVDKKSDGKLRIDGVTVYYNGQPVHNLLTERLIDAMAEGGKWFDQLLKFTENYFANPSYRAREQLWPFLEKGGSPIDEKGRFLAWKIVRNDYRDIHSGTFDNSVGQVIAMPRSEVDDDPNRTCSAGLHVCTWHYLPEFSSSNPDTDRVVIVAINPADVVAVPADYNDAKMRVCRYEVVGEVSREDAKHAFAGRSFVDDYADYNDDEGEEYPGQNYIG